MTFDWRENGFAAAPLLCVAKGSEKLYRAWGGDPRRKWGNTDLPGVCFSLDRAGSRRQAEMLYAVMEYRNPVLFLTEFSVRIDCPLWLGKVDPGDPRALLGNVSGNQVFIERAYLVLVREGPTTPLSDDLGSTIVHTGRQPRVDS
jgi:hypothetical protein